MSTTISSNNLSDLVRIEQESLTSRMKIGSGPGKVVSLIVANCHASTGVFVMLVEVASGAAPPENGAVSRWAAWMGDKSELVIPVPIEAEGDLYLCASSTNEALTLTTAVLRPLGLWRPANES